MARYKNAGFLGLILGSPFTLIGLIFMMKGKFGVGLPFLILGLVSVGSGAAASRKAAPSTDDPGTPSRPNSGGEHAEPDQGGMEHS